MEYFKIDKPVRLIELFGGISCQAQALKRLNVDFELYKYCDFDKFACKSHNEIMGTNDIPSDIKQISADDLSIIDTDEFCYIMTYSFPCTDLSRAGRCLGMEKGSGTRSSLLWEVERLLSETKELPQVLLMENVIQVHNEKNLPFFKQWCSFLESLGYSNYYEDLNAKDFGIPQSRKRTFMVSILGNYAYQFPQPIKLDKSLKNMLEDSVPEKYYLSNAMKDYIRGKNDLYKVSDNHLNINRDVAVSKTTREGQCRADTSDYICDELPQNFSLKHQMITPDGNIKRYVGSDVVDEFNIGDCADISFPNGYNKGNRVFKGYSPTINPTTTQGCFITKVGVDDLRTPNKRLKSMLDNVDVSKISVLDMYNQKIRDEMHTIRATINNDNMTAITHNYRIRKLTPKEVLRLMGVLDEDIDKMTCSDSQKYKQAGNGIVVDVLVAIFKQML